MGDAIDSGGGGPGTGNEEMAGSKHPFGKARSSRHWSRDLSSDADGVK
jgi:hypothetical protein